MLAGIRDFWVRAALALSVAAPLYFLFAAWGVKFGLFDWRFGFVQMTARWGPLVLYSATGFAALGLVLALAVKPRQGWALGLIALAVPAAMMGYGLHVRAQARGAPPIHDISTDVVDPPVFSDAVVAARAATPGVNSLELLAARIPQEERFGAMAGRLATEVQAEAYPHIASIPTGLAADTAFDMALEVAQRQPWALGRIEREAGIIEATAESFWYGFIDDIVVRVRPDGTGARIDMRSVSRVGLSDLGANARRTDEYLTELRARVEEAES